jgi:hypothetical protein
MYLKRVLRKYFNVERIIWLGEDFTELQYEEWAG